MNSSVNIPTSLRIPIMIVILSMTRIAKAQKYQKMIIYRDTKLLTEYEKAYSKYKINQQEKKGIPKIKNELLNDTRWATSDGRLTTGIISQNIVTKSSSRS